MKIFKRVLEKINREFLLQEGDKIVLAFSGGPDSAFLLEMLLELKKTLNFEIVLAHINHLLRGKDSDGDEDFVRRIGKKYGIEVYIKRVDITKEGKEKGLGLEEAGREARYNFFDEVLKEIDGNKVALAHNLDDQIETFLFRLMRGTSLEGLEGINSKGKYIRPINELYKSEIMEYLNNRELEYRIDSTNFENEFTRNSIRLDLIPFIENRYNPNFKDKIFTTIKEIRDVNNLLKIDYEDYFDEGFLSVKKMEKESNYIQSKIINSYLNNYSIKVSRDKILGILKFLSSCGSKEFKLSKNLVLKKEYDKIFVKDNSVEVSISQEFKELKVPGKIEFGNYLLEAFEAEKDSKLKNEFLTNLNVGDILTVRKRENGDKIIPTGMKNSKKVKDILINEKIPKDMRDDIPIVVFNDEVIWIAGVRGNENYKASKNGIRLKLSTRRQS
ncbi:tRNA lysidine(34) synthetase TilS [Cetobacterium sp. 2A]|uniref:tRNA lysidine(34) synthetase TilS n=1 Tax=Cetobacterium sp. 2A TaxID=2754723 RepID=UPI00163BDF9D|nr:tRNA lysidine(34) synthetase TilS [Cetobacterium sp. 2A]MBC2856561.1 tRNA lysidine(34) synthetase TilS [Cetobacterium sp. 2A]